MWRYYLLRIGAFLVAVTLVVAITSVTRAPMWATALLALMAGFVANVVTQ